MVNQALAVKRLWPFFRKLFPGPLIRLEQD